MISLQLFSLDGPFRVVRTVVVADSQAALEAAKAHAEPAGYTRVAIVEDCQAEDCLRITGRTPGGRAGRNVAMGDWLGSAECGY